jgi:alginate O-acetyltransferase complex protein AlgI
MIFNTWPFAAFLVAGLALYWSLPATARPLCLVGLGFFFYWSWYPPHVLLIGASIPLVYGVSRLCAPGRPRSRLWLALGAGGCIGLLAYYKYQGFLLGTLADLTALAGRPLAVHPPVLRPPLGISFFVFEYVHYLIEVGRGTFAPAAFGDLALFIMFFPTLICGPIKRFQLFRPQEYAQRRITGADVHAGLERILFGLAKKTIVADQLAPFCSSTFARPELASWGWLWLAVYGYAMQIYFDFAGYSDIAIGVARLFGYTVPENFARPYRQPNIAAFWRAWHMSLTSWITDYVYIPLGGSRRGEARAMWNRLVSMTLCGLWHGAAWHFAAWGLYHGLMLNAYRLWSARRPPRVTPPSPAARLAAVVVTFHVVCVGWVLFVCNLREAAFVTARLFWLR